MPRITKLRFETTPVSIDFMSNGYYSENKEHGYRGLTIFQARKWYFETMHKLFTYYRCPLCVVNGLTLEFCQATHN